MKREFSMKAGKRNQATQENPFQAKWAVLAGTKRRRAAKAATSSQRNVFADRRIGEDNPALPEDERYLARLQRERTRRNRKRARFSLAEDDAGQEEQAVAEGAKDSNPRFSLLKDDYDEVEGVEDALEGDSEGSGDELLTLKHATDGDVEETAHGQERTHQEIMNEVVLKSKMHKAKRQHEKAEGDEQTEKLDEELQDIMALLWKSNNDFIAQNASKKKFGIQKTSALVFGDDEEEEGEEGGGMHAPAKKGSNLPARAGAPGASSAFHYEKVYQQLASEKRARPSDRLLTEEEKATAERDRLLELEAKRNRRMHDAEDDESEDERSISRQRHAKRKRGAEKDVKPSGGDDLEDDFELRDDGEVPDDEELSEEEGRPQELRVDLDDDDVADSGTEVEDNNLDIDCNSMVFPILGTPKQDDSEIPFVFKNCPSTTGQLQQVFADRTLRQRALVMDRLLKCFAVSLNPTANRAKLGQLLDCMLTRVELLSGVDADNLKAAVNEIDMLLAHIHMLGKSNNESTSGWARNVLAQSFTALTASESDGGLSGAWNVSTVLKLRAVGRLFPSSDMRHPVSTPLVLLLSEALTVARMRKAGDIGLGMLVSNVLVEQMCEGGRYSGHLASFLTDILVGGCGDWKHSPIHEHFEAYRSSVSETADNHEATHESVPPLSASDCARLTTSQAQDAVMTQRKIVHAALGMTEACLFSGRLPHGDIIFSRLPLRSLPQTASRTRLLQLFISSRQERHALTLYAPPTRAAAPRLVNPKFSGEDGVFRRRPKLSYHARQSGDVAGGAARVRRALRKEERGYARDVRRAAEGEASERAGREAERRERRESGGREAMAFLEQQQAGWKKAEKRQKMLSGKKW